MRLMPKYRQSYLNRTWTVLLVVVASGLIGGALISRAVFGEPEALAYRFVPGERWHYQFKYSGLGSADMNAALSGQNTAVAGGEGFSSQVDCKGEMLMDVLEKKEGRILMAYSFRRLEVTLRVNGELQSEDMDAIVADLKQPVLAEQDSQGRIHSLWFAPEIKERSRQSVRMLLAAIQCVLPAKGSPEAEWEAWEDGPAGRCRAVYRLASDGDRKLIGLVKSREEYQQPAPKKGATSPHLSTTIEPDGEERIDFDPHLGQIRMITGSEGQAIKLGDNVFAQSESNIRLEFQNKESLPSSERARLRGLREEYTRHGATESLLSPPASESHELEMQK